MLSDTNELLLIHNYMNNDLGALAFVLAIIYILYLIIDIMARNARIEKMKKAVELINKGHKKKEKALD